MKKAFSTSLAYIPFYLLKRVNFKIPIIIYCICNVFNSYYQSYRNKNLKYTNLWSESEISLSCLILCNRIDCSLPGFSAHGIFQARILEWVTISFSRESSRPRDRTWISHIVGRRFYCVSHQGSQTYEVYLINFQAKYTSI